MLPWKPYCTSDFQKPKPHFGISPRTWNSLRELGLKLPYCINARNPSISQCLKKNHSIIIMFHRHIYCKGGEWLLGVAHILLVSVAMCILSVLEGRRKMIVSLLLRQPLKQRLMRLDSTHTFSPEDLLSNIG